MNDQAEYAIGKLEDATARLEEGIAQATDQLDRDGVIQRFEFTFEQLWKTLKIFLENQGVESPTPRSALENAFRSNLIDDEELFLKMLKDRNRTSHIYKLEQAKKVFERIKKDYLNAIKNTLKQL